MAADGSCRCCGSSARASPMKRIILFAALSLTSFANPAAGSVSRAAAAAVQALPPGAPFRDEILRFAQQDRESPPPHCALLFVGSSSIRLWSSLAEDMAPLPVINRGFGGSTISQSNLYLDRIVAPYHPRAIVFYAGENDLDAGQVPAGCGGRLPAVHGEKARDARQHAGLLHLREAFQASLQSVWSSDQS